MQLYPYHMIVFNSAEEVHCASRPSPVVAGARRTAIVCLAQSRYFTKGEGGTVVQGHEEGDEVPKTNLKRHTPGKDKQRVPKQELRMKRAQR